MLFSCPRQTSLKGTDLFILCHGTKHLFSSLWCKLLCNYVYICQIKVTLVNQKHQIPPHLQEKMSVVAGCLSLAPQLEMESIEYHRPWD